MVPGERKEVKAKSLKALEKLGHRDLKLDEYESEHIQPFSLNSANAYMTSWC